MNFQPRDDYEREAFAIKPPEFDIGDRVHVTVAGSTTERIVTDIYLRTVDLPYWMYQVDGAEKWHDDWMIQRIDG